MAHYSSGMGREIKKSRQCSNEGCTAYARNGGVCIQHGATVNRRSCKSFGCPKWARRGGLCITHAKACNAVENGLPMDELFNSGLLAHDSLRNPQGMPGMHMGAPMQPGDSEATDTEDMSESDSEDKKDGEMKLLTAGIDTVDAAKRAVDKAKEKAKATNPPNVPTPAVNTAQAAAAAAVQAAVNVGARQTMLGPPPKDNMFDASQLPSAPKPAPHPHAHLHQQALASQLSSQIMSYQRAQQALQNQAMQNNPHLQQAAALASQVNPSSLPPMGHPSQSPMGHPSQSPMGHPSQVSMHLGHPQSPMGHPSQNSMGHPSPHPPPHLSHQNPNVHSSAHLLASQSMPQPNAASFANPAHHPNAQAQHLSQLNKALPVRSLPP